MRQSKSADQVTPLASLAYFTSAFPAKSSSQSCAHAPMILHPACQLAGTRGFCSGFESVFNSLTGPKALGCSVVIM